MEFSWGRVPFRGASMVLPWTAMHGIHTPVVLQCVVRLFVVLSWRYFMENYWGYALCFFVEVYTCALVMVFSWR